MRVVYCVYDKSLRGGSYFQHLPTDLAGVAQAAYDRLIAASPEGGEPIPWPDLLGGFVRLDSAWSCIYRFVEGKDRSPRPRPLNVILMAFVRSDQIRGRDWRMVLNGTPFRQMARQAMETQGSLPSECAEEVSLPELGVPQSMVADLLSPASVGGDENRICAAVTQWDGVGAAHVVIAERGGQRSVRCHRGSMPDMQRERRDRFVPTLGGGDRPSTDVSVGGADVGPPEPVVAGLRWKRVVLEVTKYLVLCVLPVVLAAVAGSWFNGWWSKEPRPEPVVGNTYRIREAPEGLKYELIETQPGERPGFILDREEMAIFNGQTMERLVFRSSRGEERRVPRQLIERTLGPEQPESKPVAGDEASPKIQAGDGTRGSSD